ncbi:hypothetical protein ARMGADRAFT_1087960 [Armillaria gallica]|uniref:WD40 repeat-like protein n=1 Tax=Armillaria gallica TaxID=47427 RepID=A0A2H3CSH3_ARMGA|nr:hypothetical protein ARMGADRAFT_1087960 [Armillaria gallica]
MVKVFSIEDSVTLTQLWEIDVGDIPRNLAFEGNNNVQIIIHMLYNSELLLYNALTGVNLSPPIELNGGVGSAAFSPDHNTMAIHNLESNTFDVYQPMDVTCPTHSLDSGAHHRYPKKCAFVEENAQALVCGGEDGTVNVFDVAMGNLVQCLQHESDFHGNSNTNSE